MGTPGRSQRGALSKAGQGRTSHHRRGPSQTAPRCPLREWPRRKTEDHGTPRRVGRNVLRTQQPQQYATSVYRTELALRLKELGYQIEPSIHGAPEIKGYSQEYIEASSPRREQIKNHLEAHGKTGPEAAEIAAHSTRDAKLDVSHEEMQRRHQEMAGQFGHQAERIVREAEARAQHIESTDQQREQQTARQSITYAMERNFEREAVTDERDLMRDALRRSMGEISAERIRQEFDQETASGRLIEKEQEHAGPSRSFTSQEMIDLERENIRLMRAGQDQYQEFANEETRRRIQQE